MSGGNGKEPVETEPEVEAGGDMDETIAIEDYDSDNIGDISVEINVDELVARIESGDDTEVRTKREVKRRLEELEQQVEEDLDSTYNFNLDEDA